jgi:hypothetical protein
MKEASHHDARQASDHYEASMGRLDPDHGQRLKDQLSGMVPRRADGDRPQRESVGGQGGRRLMSAPRWAAETRRIAN